VDTRREIIPAAQSLLNVEGEFEEETVHGQLNVEAVRLVEGRGYRTVAEIARSLGVAENLILTERGLLAVAHSIGLLSFWRILGQLLLHGRCLSCRPPAAVHKFPDTAITPSRRASSRRSEGVP
jgi:hypothetical protein